MDWFSIKNKSSSMTEALALYKEARAPRDYKREYAQYHSKPSRVAERSQRNKARRKLGLEKGDPREVDHKNPISNGGSNARSNLRAVSLQTNRKKFTKTALMPAVPIISSIKAGLTKAVSPLNIKATADTAGRVAEVVAEGAPSMAGVMLGGQVGKAVGGRVGSGVHRIVKGPRPVATSPQAVQAGRSYSRQLKRYNSKYLQIKTNPTDTVYTPQQVQAMVARGQTTLKKAKDYNKLIESLGERGVNRYDQGLRTFVSKGEQIGQNTGMVGGALATLKVASDHHHLVTGHSGSGKSTLANKLSKDLGLPVHALDWDPEVEKLWAYQKEYAKKNDGKLDMSDERKNYEKRVKLDAIHRALKMKDPRVIEGSYLMYEDPASFGNHKRYLVNPSKETVLEQRLNRKKQKDIKRGRGWTPEAERQARQRGIEVYNLYEPYAKKWRDSSLVEKRASTKHHLITGVPGAGKSTVAKRIAKEKGLPLFEIDSDPRFKKALQLVDEGKIDESNALQRQMFRDAVTRKDPHVIEGAQIMLDPALARQHELQILDDSADVLAPRWSKREAGKHRDRALKSGREPYKDEAYYDKLYRDTVYPRYQKQLESLKKTANNPRIPRKPGQPANSDKHSDLFTDENPKGTIHGLGFKTPAVAKKSVAKIKGSGKTHAHKTQAAIAMEQRARSMGKKKAADVYRAFIEEQKRITLEKKASQACDSCGCDPCDCGWGTYAHIKEAKKLTTRARNRISEGNFALPNRRYPIHDITHARNALSMVARHGTASEKAKVRKAVKAKFPSIG